MQEAITKAKTETKAKRLGVLADIDEIADIQSQVIPITTPKDADKSQPADVDAVYAHRAKQAGGGR
jgi:hypothetical protein